ncbi:MULTISPECIES: MFS transporter [Rhodanobacter]|uniref:MFS transporter n=1 Tax=Rhodanobacter hydrolyticus TaxID=2250595 RepID=A0ABW8J4X0_9GAMM|nr:MFS transporter [Rhodanobacter sp. 7MK24]MBD8879037.1 MFS transporter [Rhodanobacter sp. 7MK24]
MNTAGTVSAPAAQAPVLLFALATGVIVQSLYVAQPLVGVIAHSLGLPPAVVSLVATLALLGYALGLFLLVPLCDLVENRRLVLATLAINALTLLVAALPVSAPVFLATSLLAGFSATVIQMLIPLAAAMTAEAQRGRVIGNITSGMMLGIMLSRPLASVIAGYLGWRASYAVLAIAIVVLLFALARSMPRLPPRQRMAYPALLSSLAALWRAEPLLRERALSVALCFGAFSAFWGMVALRLTATPFGLHANGIALFALAGVSGAISAPLAGRLGDAGKARIATLAAHTCVVLATLLAWLGGNAGLFASPTSALATLVFAAILLDAGTIGDLTLGRREINLLRPEARGRINGLYTGVFFVGGAVGSALAGFAWARAGWDGTCLAALGFGLAALISGLRRRVPSPRIAVCAP